MKSSGNTQKSNIDMRYFLFLVLGLMAIGERVFLDFGPNVELITAGMLLVGFYLGQKWGLAFVVFVMLTTDILLGSTSIYIFTWTGFLVPALVAGRFMSKRSKVKTVATGAATGIGATLFFYLWTNFGVWLLDSWGMYTNDLSGLMQSYVNALPFLRYHLTSTILFVPAGFMVVEFLTSKLPDLKNNPTLVRDPLAQTS